jgi:hypothetical protein
MLSGVDSVSILSTHTNAGLNKHATSLYISMASNLIKNFEYRRCVLCGKKRVAPINRNPLRYHRYGACPSCTRLDDFEEQMKRYREKAKDLRYVNTPTS